MLPARICNLLIEPFNDLCANSNSTQYTSRGDAPKKLRQFHFNDPARLTNACGLEVDIALFGGIVIWNKDHINILHVLDRSQPADLEGNYLAYYLPVFLMKEAFSKLAAFAVSGVFDASAFAAAHVRHLSVQEAPFADYKEPPMHCCDIKRRFGQLLRCNTACDQEEHADEPWHARILIKDVVDNK